MDSKTYYETWNRVERAAFMPKKRRVKKWLTAFITFYNRIVEKQNINWPKKCNGKFSFPMTYDPINLDCECEINEDFSGFSFKITLLEQTVSFEYSDRELCEFDYLHKHCDKKAQAINKEDLVEVLKQKVVHPAIHLHLTDDESLHEIRLGVATKNPFVFLYQFAFQMIAENKKESIRLERYGKSPLKQNELNRLVDLIETNIEEGKISPGKLLGVS